MFLSKYLSRATTRLCANDVKLLARYASQNVISNLDTDDHSQQEALNEKCILVDEEDKMIGIASKRDCHLVQADGHIPLHRAFSVFLFNSRGDLLLQKRSSAKLTFPDHYTNSCCSHPLANIQGEDDEMNAMGVKRAAQRRLNHELGIPMDQVTPQEMHYLTRIHYKDNGNGQWGEHEIDYILFIQKDVTLKPNSNEVSAISYVPRGELTAYIPELDGPLTPWFNIILKHRLKLWWDNLANLDKMVDKKKIHKLSL